MKTLLTATAFCALFATAALAQAAKEEAAAPAPTAAEIDAAVKAINLLATDQKKSEGYCAISKEMAALKEGDDKKAEELGTKMDDYIASLGKDIAKAFEIAESVDPESEDGKKLDAAYGSLEEKCGA
ncbi:MAG: hypothetical protein HC850_08000 [Rhodomicrobium sp.]|nr:hypothetical protein [Rhodomicrobium sp.]